MHPGPTAPTALHVRGLPGRQPPKQKLIHTVQKFFESIYQNHESRVFQFTNCPYVTGYSPPNNLSLILDKTKINKNITEIYRKF